MTAYDDKFYQVAYLMLTRIMRACGVSRPGGEGADFQGNC